MAKPLGLALGLFWLSLALRVMEVPDQVTYFAEKGPGLEELLS